MRTTNCYALFKAMRITLEQVQELDEAVKRYEEMKTMTDYSKIDFTKLQLEPIDNYAVTTRVPYTNVLTLYLNTLPISIKPGDTWRLTKEVDAFDRKRTDELWKRTEQVDEFIRQQSRRKITLLEFVKELIDAVEPLTIENDTGFRGTYRFNKASSVIEIYEGPTWRNSTGIGDVKELVAIVD